MNEPRERSAGVVILWIIVGVPIAWGVAQTIIKSLALFN